MIECRQLDGEIFSLPQRVEPHLCSPILLHSPLQQLSPMVDSDHEWEAQRPAWPEEEEQACPDPANQANLIGPLFVILNGSPNFLRQRFAEQSVQWDGQPEPL